ncbi:Ribosomal protein L34Ae like protein [Aduncisulcus paluster]|uniref:Ribosomal protein L34Ae like protein n=1 Tax=Aduncisulcus paluster TaxID=2918883 RepID=A0ABQ5KSI7_9EUKA|nr:Ribosomal protein L34Ae like protein [Aduncisulcus paluster]
MKTTRVQRPRRCPYNTRRNRIRVTKTDGGRLSVVYRKKTRSLPKCMDTGKVLHGMKAVSPAERASLPRREKTVSRCYGGCLSHAAVRTRILRALLVEETRYVKKFQEEHMRQQKKNAKLAKKTGKK